MHLGHPAEHLLGHPAVVGVALRRRPQLTQVIDLAEVGPEVPPNMEGQGDEVLGQGGTCVLLEPVVHVRGRLDGADETRLHPQVSQTGGRVVAERRAQQLAFLGEHAVAVEVSVGGEIGDDLELVLGVLQGPGDALAAVGPVGEQRVEHRGGIARLLLKRLVRIRKQRRRDDLSLGVPVVVDEHDAGLNTTPTLPGEGGGCVPCHTLTNKFHALG